MEVKKKRAKKENPMAARAPQAIDAYVGERVRQRRTLLGLSQEALGEELDLSFQQVQKYERGTNRISASRLYEIGEILDVPISYFFEEAGQYSISSGNNTPEQKAALQAGIGQDPFTKRETLELVRAYYKINDPAIRRRLYALVKTLAAEEDFEEDELLAS